MDSKHKLQIGLVGFGLALGGTSAPAQLQILNGDFSLNPSQANNPVDWYVPTTDTGGSWWTSTWVGPTVSPNGTSVLGLSFMGSVDHWAYQNIGTDNAGSTSMTLNFDLGSFTDAGASRTLGVTVSLYQSASFAAANGTDVNGATGVTQLGSQSVSAALNPGAVTHKTLVFDLTGANSTDPLYLRFINYQVDATEPWDAIDNVTIATVPEPSALALCGLGGLALLFRRRPKN